MLFNRGTNRGGRQGVAAPGEDATEEARIVGAELAAARERLGWTLPDIAAHLRIRKPYLAAIEQGQLNELPGNAYALGFVRTYAKSLGLDPDDVARRFRPEVKQAARKPELAFPAPVPERGIPTGAVVLLGSMLCIGAYIGWYKASGDKPGTEPVRAVPERLAELAPQPSVPTPRPAMAETAPLPGAPLASTAPSAVAAAPAPTVAPPPASPSSAQAALPDGTRILLRAKAEAWIQVRDRQGQVLLNRVLRPGETWPVPAKLQLLLTTGNAGGTELLVDGTATPSLGADGAVRRDLPLDADAIRDGKLTPTLAAAPPPRPATPAPRTQ
ncbi:MAG: DUF4115 domain-containing protein [Alphaproteobacteria bacterium]|nr:DUF4115 domain-containing protein [Alphaproteobacteria bacterium]